MTRYSGSNPVEFEHSAPCMGAHRNFSGGRAKHDDHGKYFSKIFSIAKFGNFKRLPEHRVKFKQNQLYCYTLIKYCLNVKILVRSQNMVSCKDTVECRFTFPRAAVKCLPCPNIWAPMFCTFYCGI